MKKKFTRLALILGLTGILSVNTFASTFTDVPESHWAYPGISYMQEQGYMLKNSSGAFLPNEVMTYFDFAEILAQMTGYQDAVINPNMDPVLKDTIDKMYKQELPYIQQYDNDNKYKSWRTSSNEEIAYVIARGYMNRSDLQKFMVKSATGTEMNQALTKQDLARYLVFYMGKANTAVSQYNGTGFADENLIREENRPYVAYLKSLGMVNGDSNGNFGANDKVTRALGASMTTTAILKKETLNPPVVTPLPDEEEMPVGGLIGVVSNIVPRNNADNEMLVLVNVEGTNKFYTANDDTEVVDREGNIVTFDEVAIGDTITVEVDANDYLKLIQIDKKVVTEEDTEPEEDDDEEEVEKASYVGDIDRIGSRNDLSIYTSKGTETFDLADHCDYVYDNQIVTKNELSVGDRVRVQVEGEEIVLVEILEKAVVEPTEATFLSVTKRIDSYILTVEDDKGEYDITIDEDTPIYRNDEKVDIDELTIGDVLTFEMDGDDVDEVQAESTESRIQGVITSVLIANQPQMVIRTDDGYETIMITNETEIYDTNVREEIEIYETRLGMEVEVRLESKEAISVIIEKAPSHISYEGVIQYVAPGAKEMEILVDEDPMTGEEDFLKMIEIPSGVEILVDRDDARRTDLEEGMTVRITYDYDNQKQPEVIEGWTK